jgi:hypothetical protein
MTLGFKIVVVVVVVVELLMCSVHLVHKPVIKPCCCWSMEHLTGPFKS